MNKSKKIPVTWKNRFKLMRYPKRVQVQASAPAAASPRTRPLKNPLSRTWSSIKAVSMPSRVIMSRVKKKTPATARQRERRVETFRSVFSRFGLSWGAVRHM